MARTLTHPDYSVKIGFKELAASFFNEDFI